MRGNLINAFFVLTLLLKLERYKNEGFKNNKSTFINNCNPNCFLLAENIVIYFYTTSFFNVYILTFFASDEMVQKEESS